MIEILKTSVQDDGDDEQGQAGAGRRTGPGSVQRCTA